MNKYPQEPGCPHHSNFHLKLSTMTRFALIVVFFLVPFLVFLESTSNSPLENVTDCPKRAHDNKLFAFYGSPQKCYQIGEIGPCGDGENLFLDLSSGYGVCSCECFQNLTLDFSQVQLCRDKNDKEHVHLSEWGKCFILNAQGPCGEREWLYKQKIENGSYNITCEKKSVILNRPMTQKEALENLEHFEDEGMFPQLVEELRKIKYGVFAPLQDDHDVEPIPIKCNSKSMTGIRSQLKRRRCLKRHERRSGINGK